ncbi:MAG TPA: hypothetical protein PK358_12810 [Spirochaetota bacterium]|nr:hypothetical protein [Spirochaetota bacterium]HPJ35710.1 hypothetical protein [Spirochaetota bacterium]
MYYKFRDDFAYYEDAARLLEHTRARGIIPNIPREVSFMMGQKINQELELPIIMELDTRAGKDLMLKMGSMYLVMRDDLVEELRETGVNNLDTYETIIKNPFTGENILNYKTVNIIGAIFTADLTSSDYHASDSPKQPVIGTILVHKKVKNQLEGKFPSLKFISVKSKGS